MVSRCRPPMVGSTSHRSPTVSSATSATCSNASPVGSTGLRLTGSAIPEPRIDSLSRSSWIPPGMRSSTGCRSSTGLPMQAAKRARQVGPRQCPRPRRNLRGLHPRQGRQGFPGSRPSHLEIPAPSWSLITEAAQRTTRVSSVPGTARLRPHMVPFALQPTRTASAGRNGASGIRECHGL